MAEKTKKNPFLNKAAKAVEEALKVGDVVAFKGRMHGPFSMAHGGRMNEDLYVIDDIKDMGGKSMFVVVPGISRELQEADPNSPEVRFRSMRYRHAMKARNVPFAGMLIKVPGFVVDDAELERKNFPDFKCIKPLEREAEKKEEENQE